MQNPQWRILEYFKGGESATDLLHYILPLFCVLFLLDLQGKTELNIEASRRYLRYNRVDQNHLLNKANVLAKHLQRGDKFHDIYFSNSLPEI